jgi:hypothetical protein
MNDRRPTSNAAPTTTHVGGSRSARGAALVAVLVLVGVVGLALAGRTPDVVPPSSAPAVGLASPVVATPRGGVSSPVPTAALPAASELPERSPFVLPSARPGTQGSLAVALAAGGNVSLAFLDRDPHGTLAASVRLRFPRTAAQATLELGEVEAQEGRSRFRAISTFQVGLEPLTPETAQSGVVLDRRVEAHPELGDAHELVRTGYVVRVLAESRLDEYWLWITVSAGEATASAARDPILIERVPGERRLPLTLGDDGLIGHPGMANTP